MGYFKKYWGSELRDEVLSFVEKKVILFNMLSHLNTYNYDSSKNATRR